MIVCSRLSFVKEGKLRWIFVGAICSKMGKWKQQQCCRVQELREHPVSASSLLCPFLQLCIHSPADWPHGSCWQLASFLLSHLPHRCRLLFQGASHCCPWPGPAAYSGKESKSPYYRDAPQICFWNSTSGKEPFQKWGCQFCCPGSGDRRPSLLHHLENRHGSNHPRAMLEAEPSFLKAQRKLGALSSSTVAAFFTPRWVARHVLGTVAAQWSGWAPAGLHLRPEACRDSSSASGHRSLDCSCLRADLRPAPSRCAAGMIQVGEGAFIYNPLALRDLDLSRSLSPAVKRGAAWWFIAFTTS